MKTNYRIERYRKNCDQPDEVTDVTAVGGEALAGVFGYPLNEFVNVYPVGVQHAAALELLTGMAFDLGAFDYFLDITAS